MILKDQNIMFFLRAPQHGGTENVVVQLCEIFYPIVNKIVIVSADGFEIERLGDLNIKHYAISDIENKNPKTITQVIHKIKKIVNDENITIIHTHHRMAAFYVRLTGLYKRCIFINTSHNTFTNKKGLTRFAYEKAHLIACGEMVKRNLTRYYGLKDVTVIHNAVKPFDGKVVENETLVEDKKAGKFLIGNIGRLSEQKGMEYYIQAIPDVTKKHPEAQFYIIGSGEDENKLKQMANGLPVKFLGYRADIQNLIAQMDLIVLSSLWEGLPLTPIEAFSVRKTIVATGVDGTLEIVKNKENGLLVKVKDSYGLAKRINWMIDHPSEKKMMEKRSKETYEAEFSFDILAKSYIDYYRSL